MNQFFRLIVVLTFSYLTTSLSAFSQNLESQWVLLYVHDLAAEKHNQTQDSLLSLNNPHVVDIDTSEYGDTGIFELLDEVAYQPEYTFVGSLMKLFEDGSAELIASTKNIGKAKWKLKDKELVISKGLFKPKLKGKIEGDTLVMSLKKGKYEAIFNFYRLTEADLPGSFSINLLLESKLKWYIQDKSLSSIKPYSSKIFEVFNEEGFLHGYTIFTDNEYQWALSESQHYPYYLDEETFFFKSNPYPTYENFSLLVSSRR